jgi:hypothetical protein
VNDYGLVVQAKRVQIVIEHNPVMGDGVKEKL